MCFLVLRFFKFIIIINLDNFVSSILFVDIVILIILYFGENVVIVGGICY